MPVFSLKLGVIRWLQHLDILKERVNINGSIGNDESVMVSNSTKWSILDGSLIGEIVSIMIELSKETHIESDPVNSVMINLSTRDVATRWKQIGRCLDHFFELEMDEELCGQLIREARSKPSSPISVLLLDEVHAVFKKLFSRKNKSSPSGSSMKGRVNITDAAEPDNVTHKSINSDRPGGAHQCNESVAIEPDQINSGIHSELQKLGEIDREIQREEDIIKSLQMDGEAGPINAHHHYHRSPSETIYPDLSFKSNTEITPRSENFYNGEPIVSWNNSNQTDECGAGQNTHYRSPHSPVNQFQKSHTRSPLGQHPSSPLCELHKETDCHQIENLRHDDEIDECYISKSRILAVSRTLLVPRNDSDLHNNEIESVFSVDYRLYTLRSVSEWMDRILFMLNEEVNHSSQHNCKFVDVLEFIYFFLSLSMSIHSSTPSSNVDNRSAHEGKERLCKLSCDITLGFQKLVFEDLMQIPEMSIHRRKRALVSMNGFLFLSVLLKDDDIALRTADCQMNGIHRRELILRVTRILTICLITSSTPIEDLLNTSLGSDGQTLDSPLQKELSKYNGNASELEFLPRVMTTVFSYMKNEPEYINRIRLLIIKITDYLCNKTDAFDITFIQITGDLLLREDLDSPYLSTEELIMENTRDVIRTDSPGSNNRMPEMLEKIESSSIREVSSDHCVLLIIFSANSLHDTLDSYCASKVGYKAAMAWSSIIRVLTHWLAITSCHAADAMEAFVKLSCHSRHSIELQHLNLSVIITGHILSICSSIVFKWRCVPLNALTRNFCVSMTNVLLSIRDDHNFIWHHVGPDIIKSGHSQKHPPGTKCIFCLIPKNRGVPNSSRSTSSEINLNNYSTEINRSLGNVKMTVDELLGKVLSPNNDVLLVFCAGEKTLRFLRNITTHQRVNAESACSVAIYVMRLFLFLHRVSWEGTAHRAPHRNPFDRIEMGSSSYNHSREHFRNQTTDCCQSNDDCTKRQFNEDCCEILALISRRFSHDNVFVASITGTSNAVEDLLYKTHVEDTHRAPITISSQSEIRDSLPDLHGMSYLLKSLRTPNGNTKLDRSIRRLIKKISTTCGFPDYISDFDDSSVYTTQPRESQKSHPFCGIETEKYRNVSVLGHEINVPSTDDILKCFSSTSESIRSSSAIDTHVSDIIKPISNGKWDGATQADKINNTVGSHHSPRMVNVNPRELQDHGILPEQDLARTVSGCIEAPDISRIECGKLFKPFKEPLQLIFQKYTTGNSTITRGNAMRMMRELAIIPKIISRCVGEDILSSIESPLSFASYRRVLSLVATRSLHIEEYPQKGFHAWGVYPLVPESHDAKSVYRLFWYLLESPNKSYAQSVNTAWKSAGLRYVHSYISHISSVELDSEAGRSMKSVYHEWPPKGMRINNADGYKTLSVIDQSYYLYLKRIKEKSFESEVTSGYSEKCRSTPCGPFTPIRHLSTKKRELSSDGKETLSSPVTGTPNNFLQSEKRQFDITHSNPCDVNIQENGSYEHSEVVSFTSHIASEHRSGGLLSCEVESHENEDVTPLMDDSLVMGGDEFSRVGSNGGVYHSGIQGDDAPTETASEHATNQNDFASQFTHRGYTVQSSQDTDNDSLSSPTSTFSSTQELYSARTVICESDSYMISEQLVKNYLRNF